MTKTLAEPITWIDRKEAVAIVPGLNVGKLDRLRAEGVGPPAWVLSDGDVLINELLFRRWVESTVNDDWVRGIAGDRARPRPTPEREYTYDDARIDELRRRTYISPPQLLLLLPDLAAWQANEMRAGGVGPRFLTPTPKTIVYIAEEALWWSEQVPSYSASHERGTSRDGERRPLLTPPVAVRRQLTLIEIARLRDQP